MKRVEFNGKKLTKYDMASIMHNNTEHKKDTNYYEYLPCYLYCDIMTYEEMSQKFNEYLMKN